ncbi:hypothetical protein CBF23_007935 [Marinomonas agarivorans]|nr:hypothetical protein CBF23_007935 [Marinomonas agarivorans]
MTKYTFPLIGLFVALLSPPLQAQCSDVESVERTEKAAIKLLGNGKVFEQGKVLKLHLPSKRKETAVYIQSQNKHYTFFGLVTTDCKAYLMKRTHGKY